TGFIELFKDDGIPYLLIGDGAADGVWDLSFFIAETGENPHNDTDDTTAETKDSGGGGGCSAGMAGGAVAALSIGAALLRRRRMC
ncbi:MAG: hypothetical protein IJ702_06075, partial [Fretibacterium sp.]|nr:hypothetical protein [Fretibacterium sp.]